MMNGRTLREMRLRAGMTVQDLSAKAEISEATIELFESGKRNGVKNRTLIALAKAFELDVIDFENILNGTKEQGSAESKAATA